MDKVFKALADSSRRRLLDRLFKRDGQTLGDLERHLPDMTRFGVMNHLRVLEEAHLVTSKKIGRERLHYLNPVPIRAVFDRWTSKYAVHTTRVLADLKLRLETRTAPMTGPRHVYETYIRTTPQDLWNAITHPEFTRAYYFGMDIESTWEEGAAYTLRQPDGSVGVEGVIVEADPPHRLVQTFRCPVGDKGADRPSRVTWTIEQQGATCKLTLVHDDFDGETATFSSTGPGWHMVLSGLKTILETGRRLDIGAA